jgi:hypothetical protein
MTEGPHCGWRRDRGLLWGLLYKPTKTCTYMYTCIHDGLVHPASMLRVGGVVTRTLS